MEYNFEDIEKDLHAITNFKDKEKWEHFGAKTKGTFLNRINKKYPNRPKGTHLNVYLELLLGKYSSKQERKEALEKQYFKDYYEKNKEHKLAYQKEYAFNNKEHIKKVRAEYRINNLEKIREINREYKKNNKGIINAQCAKRRADKILRTPKWANIEEIKEYYNNCPEGQHVDHIYPLKGEYVSGLHVIENLQYLDAFDNMSKGNKYIPT